MHFIYNPFCTRAIAVSTLNSIDPGIQLTIESLQAIPGDVLAANLMGPYKDVQFQGFIGQNKACIKMCQSKG